MKVSDRQSPAEKGHLILTSVVVLPKHTESLSATPAEMLSLPRLHKRPFGILGCGSTGKSAPKANKTFPFTQANLHLFALLRGLEAKKRKEEKTNRISDKNDSVLLSSWQSTLSPSAGTCK